MLASNLKDKTLRKWKSIILDYVDGCILKGWKCLLVMTESQHGRIDMGGGIDWYQLR